jgi:hypothetical protein
MEAAVHESRLERLRRLAMCATVLAMLACGGDDGGKQGEDEPEGEPCASPGQSMTGCVCSQEQPPGSRRCTSGGVWSPCTCPPPRPDSACVQGDRIQCVSTCPGESEPRVVMCLQGNTFDCSCDSGPPPDAGRPPASDGGP